MSLIVLLVQKKHRVLSYALSKRDCFMCSHACVGLCNVCLIKINLFYFNYCMITVTPWGKRRLKCVISGWLNLNMLLNSLIRMWTQTLGLDYCFNQAVIFILVQNCFLKMLVYQPNTICMFARSSSFLPPVCPCTLSIHEFMFWLDIIVCMSLYSVCGCFFFGFREKDDKINKYSNIWIRIRLLILSK